ncbi:hypothetical protein MOQ72_21815 [Saccharopolyspora sp. K220]|uniref:hypothetical protein n=1 Tax=Saccharopolyspora soli TaxID=2926618 RepID=UPI001F593279|nr:hypothetical protein [Saccharopolyspora soli]MCI2420083.1 hypothetical protein [Saccharopolyspora soli]
MLSYIPLVFATVRARIAEIRADERGYSTETVLVTALLVAAALAVMAIIIAAVTRKAGEIGGSM